MADENKRVDIRFQTTADTSGAEQAEAAIRGTEAATEQAAEEAKRLDAAFAGLDAPALTKIRAESQTTAQAAEQLRTRAVALDAQLAQVRGFARWGSGARQLRTEAAQTREAIKRLETQIRATSATAQSARFGGAFLDTLSQMPGTIGAAGAALSRFSTKAVAGLAASVLSVIGAMKALAAASRQASQMEDLEATFTTLLGSTEAAKARMQELATFAAKTPFEIPGVTQASRILQTFGGDQFATGENLRLLGDIAAATQQPIEELAIWVGRLYDGIQSGRPVGEAMQRLQELALVSGQTRAEIEALQKEGARGERVWQLVTKEFGRYAGEMERRTGTISQLLSEQKDGWGELLRIIGQPVNDAIRPVLQGINVLLGTVNANARKTLQSFGLIPRQAPGLVDMRKKVDDIAESWQSTEAATAAALTRVDQLGQSYELARARAEQLADSQERIADAEEERRLAEIEAREDITEAERLRLRSQITGEAEESRAQREIQRIQEQIQRRDREEAQRRQQLADAERGLSQAQQREEDIGIEIKGGDFSEQIRAARAELQKTIQQIEAIDVSLIAKAQAGIAPSAEEQEQIRTEQGLLERRRVQQQEALAALEAEQAKAAAGAERLALDLAKAQSEIAGFTEAIRQGQEALEKFLAEPFDRVGLEREQETIRREQEIRSQTRDIQTGKELGDATRAELQEALARQAEQQAALTTTLVEQLQRQLEDLPAVVQEARPGTRTEEFLAELARRREAIEAEGGAAEPSAIPALNALRELITRGLRTPTAEIRAALEPLRTAIDTLISAITERERIRTLAESERTPAPQPPAALDARIDELGRIIASAIAGLRAGAQRPAEAGDRPPPAPVSRADEAALRERGLTTAAALPTLERILARLTEARFGETPPAQDVGPLIIAIQQLIEALRTREAARPAAALQPTAAPSPEIVSLARRVADGIARVAATPVDIVDDLGQQIQQAARRETLPAERLETPEAIPTLERLLETIGPDRETAPALRGIVQEIRSLIAQLRPRETPAARPAPPAAIEVAISRIEQALTRREPSRAPDAAGIDPALAGEIREALRDLARPQERTSSTEPLERREANVSAALEELATRLTRERPEDPATRELVAEIRNLIRILSAPPPEQAGAPRGGADVAEIARRIEEAIRAIPSGAGLDADTRAAVRALVAAVRERDIPARAPRAQGAPTPQPLPGLERAASQIEAAGFRDLAQEIRQLVQALRARETPAAPAPRAEPEPARITPRPREVRQPLTPQPALAPQDGAARQAAAGIASDTAVADALLAIGAALQTQGAQQQAAAQTLLATLQSLTNQQRALLSRMSTLEQQTRNLRD